MKLFLAVAAAYFFFLYIPLSLYCRLWCGVVWIYFRIPRLLPSNDNNFLINFSFIIFLLFNGKEFV